MVDDLQADGFPKIIEECAIGNGEIKNDQEKCGVGGVYFVCLKWAAILMNCS
jgi:hypothetical protein